MSREQSAVEAAAEAVLGHGGPECRTDPHTVLDAIGAALKAGSTHDDIAAELRRQRGEN
ncbi:hypothetical protein [Streptomyces sp. NPDC002851]